MLVHDLISVALVIKTQPIVVTIAYYPAAYTVIDGSNFKRKASSETSLDCV